MANKKITQLVTATGVTGPDVVPIVSGGATKKVTLTTLSGFFAVTGPTGPAGVGETYQSNTAPPSGSAGATWFNPSTGEFHVRSGGQWLKVGQTS